MYCHHQPEHSIEAAPLDGQITESSIFTILSAKYGAVLSFSELLEATKVGRSSARNFKNPKHRRYDRLYPVGFPLFDSENSPQAFWARDVAKWLFNRHNHHFITNKV